MYIFTPYFLRRKNERKINLSRIILTLLYGKCNESYHGRYKLSYQNLVLIVEFQSNIPVRAIMTYTTCINESFPSGFYLRVIDNHEPANLFTIRIRISVRNKSTMLHDCCLQLAYIHMH